MDRELAKTFICTNCNHNATVCTCPVERDGKPVRRIIPFVAYIESKYHDKFHGSWPEECYVGN